MKRFRSHFSPKSLTMLVACGVVVAIAVGLATGAGASTADRAGAAGYYFDDCQNPEDNNPPTAAFDYSPIPPRPGQEITFTSTSSDPDGDELEAFWFFPGHAQEEDSGDQVKRTYAAAGDYQVELIVFDGCDTDEITRTVHVEAAPPAPPPPPPPPDDTKGPTIVVSKANNSIRISRRGVFTFVVGPFTEDVTGNVSFATVKLIAARKKKRVSFGTKSFNVRKGKRVNVKVKVPKRARRALRRSKKLRVRARLVARDSLGNATSKRKVFTLRAAKKKRKKKG